MLRPERIACVLVSEQLATTVGNATNVQIRYDNHIEPYVEQLKAMGADVYDIERYGQAIILKDSGKKATEDGVRRFHHEAAQE